MDSADVDGLWDVFYWCVMARRVEGVPALSGGLLDAWPAWLVDALPVFDAEVAALQRYVMHLEETGHG